MTTFEFRHTAALLVAGLLSAGFVSTAQAQVRSAEDCLGNIPPIVTITSPASNATSPAPGAFTLTASADDSDGVVGSIQLIADSTVVKTVTNPTGSVTANVSGLIAGSHSLKAKATDDCNVSVTKSVTVTVAGGVNQAPTITLTSPSNGASLVAPATFSLAATATDSDGSIANVQFKSGSTVIATDSSSPYTYSYANLPQGTYSFSAVATDSGGATATSSTVTVTVSAAGNSPPTVSLTSPANGASQPAGGLFSIAANASDTDGSIATVKFMVNGVFLGSDDTAPYTFAYTPSAPGSVSLTAVAIDNGGASTTSAARNVTVTAAPNVAAVRTFVYDNYHRLCKTINPESGATVIDYDGAGNIAWTADGLNLLGTTTCDRASVTTAQKTVRTYDPMNRVTAVSTPNGTADVLTEYYADGQVSKLTAANPDGYQVITNYEYNKRRLLTKETSAQPGWYSWPALYAYDANGHLSSLTYPEGVVLGYAPDALGRATQVGPFASGISYYPNGAIKQFTYGNGVVHTMTQNLRGLPGRSQDMNGSTAILDDSYSFDENGNVTDIIDQAQGTSRGMAYDGLDRLTTAVSVGTASVPMWGTAQYTYDALDNLKTSSLGSSGFTYSYDVNNRLASLARTGGGTYTYTYDANGNVVNDGRQDYQWDSANRLLGVTGKEGYRYDGQGRRVLSARTSGPNQLTLYMYSQAGQVLHVEGGLNNESTANIYLGNALLAVRTLSYATGAISVRYQHTDALGSPVATSDANRNVVDRTIYAPYGAPVNRPVDGVGYTGHVMDVGTGLIYMQQRYYDPVLARFISVDPIEADEESFNRYWYANGSPYGFTDPDGRSAWDTFRSAIAPTGEQFAERGETGTASSNAAGALIQVANTGIGLLQTAVMPPPVVALTGGLPRIPLANNQLGGAAAVELAGNVATVVAAGAVRAGSAPAEPPPMTPITITSGATRASSAQITAGTSASTARSVLQSNGYTARMSRTTEGAGSLTNGTTTYNFYPSSRSSSVPTARVTTNATGHRPAEIRFAQP